MDTVFNALNNELPFDRVSNQINTSIQLYKDGKDECLLNGQNDIKSKTDVVNDFYEKLKTELRKEHGDADNLEVEPIGTALGRYLIDNQNNIVERASEAFVMTGNTISWSVMKMNLTVLLNRVRKQSAVYIGLNKDFRNSIFKMNDKNSLVNFKPSEENKNDKRKLVDVLLDLDPSYRVIKDVDVPKGLTNISEMLRATIAVTTPVKEHKYSYYTRVANRTKILAKYIENVCSSIGSGISKVSDTVEDIERFKPMKDFTKIKEYTKDTMKSLKKESESSDIFPYRTQDYRLDVGTFYMKQIDELEASTELGIRFSDYKLANRDTDAFTLDRDSKTESTVTIRSIGNMTKIKDLMYVDSIIGSGNLDLTPSGQKGLNLIDLCGDMTVGEFYTEAEKLSKYVLDLDAYLCDSAWIVERLLTQSMRNIGSASVKISSRLGNIKIFNDEKAFRLAKCCFSMANNALIDTLTTAEATEYILGIDYLQKKKLCDIMISLISCFDMALRSALGE